MADLQLLVQQLAQGQIDLQNHIAALANAQAAPAAAAHKKVVADPDTYDGSPAKFHKWWSKIKIWIQVSMQGATDAKVAVAIYSRLVLDKGLVTLGGSRVRVSAGGGGGCNLGTRKPFDYPQAPLWQQYYAVW